MTRWLAVTAIRHSGMVQLDYTDDRQDIRVTYIGCSVANAIRKFRLDNGLARKKINIVRY